MSPLDTSQVWLTMGLMAVGTVAARASFLVGLGRRQPGPRLRRLLKAVPAAVLSALVAPSILAAGDAGAGGISPRLVAGLVAAGVAWKTRNPFLTIGTGMLVLWLIQSLA